MGEYENYHVLDINYYEVANALKHMVPKRIAAEDAHTAFIKAKKMMNLFSRHSFLEVIDEASALSIKFDITIYDAAFVSLSEQLGVRFLTLDEKLAQKFKNTKHHRSFDYPNDSMSISKGEFNP